MEAATSVFVVEDETLIAMELEDRLGHLGYAVCGVASNGEAALADIEKTKPDLVLMDINLPGRMDGIETAGRLNEGGANLPVVFLTAYSDEETLQRALGTEPFGYLLKPFDERELHTTIQAALYKHRMEQSLRDANQRLERSSRQFQDLVEFGPDALVMTGLDGRIALLNSQTERLFGWKRDEILGQQMEVLVPEAMRQTHESQRASFAAAGETRVVMGSNRTGLTGLRKDGTEFPVEITLARIETVNGKMLAAAVRDITERKKMEERLNQAMKLEAVGRLTGGMAHDFNNLLGIVIGNVELALEADGIQARSRRNLDNALTASRRGAELTRSLLAFARRQPLDPTRVDLNKDLMDLLNILGRTLGDNVEVMTSLGTDVWPVIADPAQLDSSILNLANNARDAMPDGGKLSFTTRNVHLEESDVENSPEVAPGDYVLLEITDTGVGITPDALEKVIEPFFTTKGVGHGTGLGLSMVYGFAKQSGGHITIYSEAGKGTTVRLYLPRAAVSLQAAEKGESRKGSVEGGTETILVVEDNAALRETVTAQLELLGYRVIDCDGPAAALKILRSDTPLDVLHTDIVMPGGLSGYELVEEAARLRPGIKILMTSGFADEMLNRKDKVPPGVHFLAKPHRFIDLAAAIRKVIAEK